MTYSVIPINWFSGHAAISRGLSEDGIGVATGEHCQNRVLFKQFLQTKGLQFCQIDSCRMGGLNEVLAVLLMAAKFGGMNCRLLFSSLQLGLGRSLAQFEPKSIIFQTSTASA